MNVRNMFAGTTTSSTGDRMYVEIQQIAALFQNASALIPGASNKLGE